MGNALKFEELTGKVGLVTFDVPGQSVNTFSQPVLAELAQLVGELEHRSDLRGLLLQSGKKGQFIAGADLKELGGLAFAPKAQIQQGLELGHQLFGRVSRLPFPTVALIDGNCMGGGTELALAMDYRIATDGRATKIGLPEVKVGLIPAWGGTQRLPRVVGVNSSIEMICTGEPVSADRAAAIGLVFDAVPAENLVDEGRRLIDYAQQSGEWKRLRQRKEQPLGLSEDQMNFAFAIAFGKVMQETKGQYPAPLAAIKAMQEGVNRPLEEALKVETMAALEVIGTPVNANLIGVFFMNNQLERDRGVDDPHVKARDVRRVGVLGAGLMGSGIATAHARSGIPTGMVDVDDARIADGLRRASEVVTKRMQIGRAKPEDLTQMLAMLSTSTSHALFSDCDVVIEAVPENEQLKTNMYKKLSGLLRDDAILASNTSTISITRMAQAAPAPERFVGMHFFLPVDRMPLVEVIRGDKTSDETVATIVALTKRIRKTPIVCRDCAGFLVNRCLLPYMNEALVLLLEGASMDDIDKAATRFGMPMGPIALQDMVGIDTSCYAGRVLLEAYKDRAVEMPLMDDLVAAGRLGKKSGAGFRKVGKKGRPEPDPGFQPFLEKHRTGNRAFGQQELQERLFLPWLLEATRVLEENIVREPGHVDMGMILGTGFPPYRGGILRWCDTEGADKMLKIADKYAPLGKRFESTESLRNMAKTNGKFYPVPKAALAAAAKK